MKLKPFLYTLLTLLLIGGCFFINVEGKPLIAWILVVGKPGLGIPLIFSEVYDMFAGPSGTWLDIYP